MAWRYGRAGGDGGGAPAPRARRGIPSAAEAATARLAASAWAQALLARGAFAVLDTETTGTGDPEIVQMAVVGPGGEPLLETRVRPLGPVGARASGIHGLYARDLTDAPGFKEVYPRLAAALRGREILAWNAPFDRAMVARDAARHGLPPPGRAWTCAMRASAPWYGAWDAAQGRWKSTKLEGGDHSALGDAGRVLDVLRRMAGDD